MDNALEFSAWKGALLEAMSVQFCLQRVQSATRRAVRPIPLHTASVHAPRANVEREGDGLRAAANLNERHESP